MASAIDYKKVLACVKKGLSLSKTADEVGGSVGAVAPFYYKAEPEVDPSLKFKATGKNVKDAYENKKLRWDRIAARTGESITKVKALYEEAGGKIDKGTRVNAASDEDKAAKAKAAKDAKAAAKADKPASAKNTSRSGKGASGTTGTRSRTRAERASKVGSPS